MDAKYSFAHNEGKHSDRGVLDASMDSKSFELVRGT